MESAPEQRARGSGPQAGQPPLVSRGGLVWALQFAVLVVSSVWCWAFLTVGVLVAAPLGLAAICWLLSAAVLPVIVPEWRHTRVVTAAMIFFEGAALSAFLAVPAGFVCVLGVIAVWALLGLVLWWLLRRVKPRVLRLSRRAMLLAEGLALAPGVALGLFLGMDEAPKQFPHLAVERSAVAEADNGFLVLEEMWERLPLDKDAALERSLGWPPGGPGEGTPEWTREARAVLAKWQPCLEGLDSILARPRLSAGAAAQPPESSLFWVEPWLPYERRLAQLKRLQSKLLLADGRAADAMKAADEIVQFGLRIQAGPGDITTWLVGDACIQIGTEQVRQVACASSTDRQVLVFEAAVLPVENELRSGFRTALAGELARYRAETADLADWSKGGPASIEGFQERERAYRAMAMLVREPTRPMLKVNMTANLVGARLDDLASSLERFQPSLATVPPADEGAGALASRIGWGRFLRNAIGAILADMLGPVHDRLYVEYYRMLADLRATRLFLALRGYQLENRRLPKALDDLAPKYLAEVPPDPFTDKPFVYEPDATPARLLSVGPGQTPDAPDAQERDDIVLELAFPSP